MTAEDKMLRALWFGIVALVVVVVLVIFGCAVAFAIDGHTHEGPTGQFYKSWMMPDNRKVSCCHDQDCKPAEAKFENGRWIARHAGEGGAFTPVPQSKIEQERDSPDGRNHLCARRDGFGGITIFCFLPAPGG